MKVEVFSQWNELERATSYTGRTGQNIKAKTTALELHSGQSERGHSLHLGKQRSVHILGTLLRPRDTESLHILLLRGSSESVSFYE